MRTLLSIVGVLSFVAMSSAQTGPYLAQVTADGVVVRSGEGESMPETGTLARGERVIVVQQIGEKWLAIEPPRGQVSWVRNIALGAMADQPKDVIPRNAVIQADSTIEISAGRPGVPKPLDVRRVAIPDGTIVKVIGTMVEHNGMKWVPIEPPDGDLRYIPKSAVQSLNRGPTAAYSVTSPKPDLTPTTGGTIPATSVPLPNSFQPSTASVPNQPASFATTGTGRTKPDNWPSHPLWQQAEQAELAREYAKAESLYLKLAAEMNQTNGDPELANLCYTRVHAVREKQRSNGRPTPSGSEPVKRNETPQATANQWVGPGELRLAGFRMDGRTTYALVSTRGQVKCYAIPGPGLDLERFRGDVVDLYGSMTYPGDLRGVGVMTATRAQSVRRE